MIIAFGPRWDAPETDDATWAATPVGDGCAYCADTIELGDQGVLMGTLTADGEARTVPAHAGCRAQKVIGHIFGVCRCTGYTDGGRAAGDALWRRLDHTPISMFALSEWIGREPYDGDAVELFDALRRRAEEPGRRQ